MFSENDTIWMQRAIQLAHKATQQNEVPVGAVLVLENKIIGEGFNSPIGRCDPTAHAEMIALRQGAQHQQNYRLVHSTLYVTLEPCLMCVGAITHARVERIVFGAFDSKSGTVIGKAHYEGGLLAEECGKMLSQFFQNKRVLAV